MSKSTAKHEIMRVIGARCIICGGDINDKRENSYDHFVPQAFLTAADANCYLGVVFPAHQRCNSRRGHAPPTPAMIERAAEWLAGAGTSMLCEAVENIDRLAESHRVYLETLEKMRAQIGARLKTTEATTA